MVKTNNKKVIPLKLKRQESGVFKRRIGQTTYRVSVHFNDKSHETMDEKIIRIIRNEAVDEKVGTKQ